MKRTASRWKELTIVLFLIVAVVNVNQNKNTFALSTHCDREAMSFCYSIGYGKIKQSQVIRSSNDNSEYFWKIQKDDDSDNMNNNEIQNVNYYSLSISSNSNSNQDAKLFFVFIVLLIIGYLALKLRKRKKPKERRGFPQYVKEKVLRKQDHKCAHCKKLLNVVDWDHKNGNRSDNRESNCQALCPNCHAIKTRRAQSKR